MTSFRVGQVVVCIDDTEIPCWEEIQQAPKEGGVYTIRAIGTDEKSAGVLLEEIRNPHGVVWPCGTVREMGFNVHRFRPAEPTSIEVFEVMLEPEPEGAASKGVHAPYHRRRFT